MSKRLADLLNDSDEDDEEYQPSESDGDSDEERPSKKQKMHGKGSAGGFAFLSDENGVNDDSDDDYLYSGESNKPKSEIARGKMCAVDQAPPDTSALLGEIDDEDDDDDDDGDFKPRDDDEDDEDEEQKEEENKIKQDKEALRDLVHDEGDDPYLLYKDMTKNVETVLTEITASSGSSSASGSSSGSSSASGSSSSSGSGSSSGSSSSQVGSSSNSSSASSSNSSNQNTIESGSSTLKTNMSPIKKENDVDDFWKQMNQGVVSTPKKTLSTPSKTTTTPKPKPTTTPSKTPSKQPTSEIDDFFASMNDSTPKEKKKPDVSLAEAAAAIEAQTKQATLTTSPVPITTSHVDPLQVKANRLDALLNKMQNKKEATIRTSKKDWEQFKAKEGITEDLKQATKDGYLEKQAFLSRTEMRQFEQDSELRNQERERQR
ncbi:CFDP1, partial [Acrasis kona]